MSFVKQRPNELQTMLKITRAEKLFGFDKNAPYGPQDVRKRFTELVKEAHPDAGDQGEAVIKGKSFQQLREAKDVLIGHLREGGL